MTPRTIERPPDVETVSESVVLNDIIEQWIELVDEPGADSSFLDAFSVHYRELIEIIRECSPVHDADLIRATKQELAILNKWLYGFTRMFQDTLTD